MLAQARQLSPRIDRLGQVLTALGECPIWDDAGQRLWLLDCRAGHIHALDWPAGTGQHFSVPAPAGSMALNDDGLLVVALKEDIALVDPLSGRLQTLARIGDQHPNLRLNDGAAMPDGSFVVGTMHTLRSSGEAPLGGLYRLDCSGQLERIAMGFGVVNGPVMHPSNGRLHVADSAARTLWSYAVDAAGRLRDPQVFARTDELDSAPDGCCFDSEGGLWTALVHVGALARFDSLGQLTHRISLPAAHPASLCFAGNDMDELVVTTIRDSGRLKSEGPWDGAVLRLRDIGFQGVKRPVCRIRARP